MGTISLRNMPIPVIREDEFIFQEDKEQGLTHIFYGCLDINKKEYCKALINEKLLEYNIEEFFFPNDFKLGIQFGSKKWYVEDNMNIYQDEFITPATSIILYKSEEVNKLSFKVRDNLAFWIIFKGSKKQSL